VYIRVEQLHAASHEALLICLIAHVLNAKRASFWHRPNARFVSGAVQKLLAINQT
jgi:hypothetical protein